MRNDEHFSGFMTNTMEAVWCVEFDQPIPIDLPEDEQIGQIYKYAYISEANDEWAQSAGFECNEDIPLLVNWFVDKFKRKMGKQIESIPSALLVNL